MVEVVLPHVYHAQQKGYTCGPSAAKVTLSTFGISVTERDMERACKTTVNGTNDIRQITSVISARSSTPYKNFYIPNPTPTRAQKDLFWAECLNTIYGHRRGMPINVWVPAYGLPGYPGQLIMHYITGTGIRTHTRQIYISDSARFSGIEHYWVEADRLAGLITPKGYGAIAARATTAPGALQDPFWTSLTPLQRVELAGNFRQLGLS